MNANAQTIPVLIRFPGEWFLFDIDIEISLDGESLGKFSIKKGFNIDKYILPGKHTISTTVPIRGTKEFPFELNKNEPTVLNLSYSRTWGDFGGLKVSEAKMRLLSLYEKKTHKWLGPLCIILGIVCFILYLWCWHIADEYGSYEYYCHGRGRFYDDDGTCKVMQERYGDLTEEEAMMQHELWEGRMVLSILSSIPLFIGAVMSFKNNKNLAEEIEKLELDNYNRGKKKAERERRRNADKAESERIWYAQEAERKEKIDLAQNLWDKGGLENLLKALSIYSEYNYDMKKLEGDIAKEKEKHLDYDGALFDFERLGLHKSAKRIRQKIQEQKRAKQTIIQGDYIDDRDTTYIDDRDTIVKDSVINRSNIGAGGKSKAEQVQNIKELLDSGLIDAAEFQQMKKEILGK